MGYNTDEAVYAGQAAAIAGVPYLKDMFPVFRAHPLLFQFILSLYLSNPVQRSFGAVVSRGGRDRDAAGDLSDWKDCTAGCLALWQPYSWR